MRKERKSKLYDGVYNGAVSVARSLLHQRNGYASNVVTNFSIYIIIAASDGNMYNKKSSVGLILTAEFSEVVKTALDQQIPDYLTYTRLTDLVNNTVSYFYF